MVDECASTGSGACFMKRVFAAIPNLKNADYRAVAALAIGVTGGILSVATFHLPLKWMAAFIAGSAATVIILVKRPDREFWLLTYFLTCSIALNFHPVYLPRLWQHPVRGISINFYDFPLFFLFLAFAYRRLVLGTRSGKTRIYLIPLTMVMLFTVIRSAFAGENCLMLACMAWALIKCMLLFTVITESISTRRRLSIAVTGMLCAVALQSAAAFTELLNGKPLGLAILGEMRQVETLTSAGVVRRVGGLIGTENQFSKYLGMHLPLVLAMFFAAIEIRRKLLLFLPLLIAACAADVATYCRGGWISVTLGLAVTLALCLSRSTGRPITALIAPTLVAFVAAAVLFALPTARARLSRIETGSGIVRLHQDIIALNMLRNHPLTGIGFGRFVPSAGRYDDAGSKLSISFHYPPHNEYLLMASELGLPVLAVYLFIVMLTGINALKGGLRGDGIYGYVNAGMLGGLVAYSLHDLFEWSWAFQSVYLWSYMALARSAYLLATRREGRSP